MARNNDHWRYPFRREEYPAWVLYGRFATVVTARRALHGLSTEVHRAWAWCGVWGDYVLLSGTGTVGCMRSRWLAVPQ